MAFELADDARDAASRVAGGSDAVGAASPVAGLAGKRVLVVMNSDEGGGVEHLAGVLSRDFERQGASVSYRFLYSSTDASAKAKLAGLARAASDIWRMRPDVVMSFQPTSSVVAGFTAWAASCRVRLVHESNVPASTHPLPRLLDRLAGSLGIYSVNIMNSAATQATFASYPASYRRRMRRIDHGIAWRPPTRSRAEVLAHYAVPPGSRVLLACARLVAQKGLDVVVEALPALPGVRFVIAGHGPAQHELEQLAARRGVGGRLHFIGHVPHEDVFDLYAAADAFLFPSVWETFGLAAAEAAMLGLPVVASDLAVTREVLSAGGESPVRFVASRQPTAWAAAIDEVLRDPESAGRAQQFAERVRAKYSEDAMLRHYRVLCEDLLARDPPSRGLPA